MIDEQRTISVTPYVEEPEVRERLLQQRLGHFEFTSKHGVRKTLGPKAREEDAGNPWWHGRLGIALRLAFAVLLTFYGWLAYDRSALGQLAMCTPVIVLAWFIGKWYTSNQSRPWLLRWAAGILFVASGTLPGYMWHHQNPYGVTAQIRSVLFTLGVLALMRCVPQGCWLAVRQTWITRHAVGLLTVIVLPLPWVLPFVGSFLKFLYVEDSFRIPTEVVSVPVFWTGASALLPTLSCTGLFLAPLALYGWARYFHLTDERSVVSVIGITATCLAIVLVLTGGEAFLNRTSGAARHAALTVVSARTPAPYFGIQGQRMCVEPLEDKISVQNGPLPTDRPLLTFSTEGEVLYLWDPVRARKSGGSDPVVSVHSSDVSTYEVKDGVSRCPERT